MKTFSTHPKTSMEAKMEWVDHLMMYVEEMLKLGDLCPFDRKKTA